MICNRTGLSVCEKPEPPASTGADRRGRLVRMIDPEGRFQVHRPMMPMLLALLSISLVPAWAFAAAQGPKPPSTVIFLCQIIALLVCGRLLGEVMQRIGQPAVMGQLIAGILLGPSVLGALWPELQHALFPRNPEQKA